MVVSVCPQRGPGLAPTMGKARTCRAKGSSRCLSAGGCWMGKASSFQPVLVHRRALLNSRNRRQVPVRYHRHPVGVSMVRRAGTMGPAHMHEGRAQAGLGPGTALVPAVG